MGTIMTVAAVQLAPTRFMPDKGLERMQESMGYIDRVIPSTELAVYPELYVQGLTGGIGATPGGFLDAVAETIPGPLTEQLCALAKRSGRWLVPGSIVERDGANLYNTALAIAPTGTIAARYRKLFPWMPHERLTPGTSYTTFDIDDACRVGICICYDGWVPEIPRTLSWMGAQVIVQPTGTSTSDRRQELVLAQANAITNQVYVVNPNVGQAFGYGRSVIVDPEGRVLAEAGSGEEILTATLDMDLVGAVRERGTLGMSPLWKQLRDFPPPLPFAEQGYARGRVMKGLGPLWTPENRSGLEAAERQDAHASGTCATEAQA